MLISKKILSTIVLSTALIFSASANAAKKSTEVDCENAEGLDAVTFCYMQQAKKYRKQLDAKVKKEIERLNKDGFEHLASDVPGYIKAWEVYVDELCSITNHYSVGGKSSETAGKASCIVDEIKKEIKHLDDIL